MQQAPRHSIRTAPPPAPRRRRRRQPSCRKSRCSVFSPSSSCCWPPPAQAQVPTATASSPATATPRSRRRRRPRAPAATRAPTRSSRPCQDGRLLVAPATRPCSSTAGGTAASTPRPAQAGADGADELKPVRLNNRVRGAIDAARGHADLALARSGQARAPPPRRCSRRRDADGAAGPRRGASRERKRARRQGRDAAGARRRHCLASRGAAEADQLAAIAPCWRRAATATRWPS